MIDRFKIWPMVVFVYAVRSHSSRDLMDASCVDFERLWFVIALNTNKSLTKILDDNRR